MLTRAGGATLQIGYTDFNGSQPLQSHLRGVCDVQHGPWDTMDGGAGSTSEGVTCLDNWLRTQDQQVVKWDVIQFVRAPPPLAPPQHLPPP